MRSTGTQSLRKKIQLPQKSRYQMVKDQLINQTQQHLPGVDLVHKQSNEALHINEHQLSASSIKEKASRAVIKWSK